MRTYRSVLAALLSVAASAFAQEASITPTAELRATLSEWIETMQKIQAEEDEWARDQEVLANYRDGLEKEIADLTEQIAAAKTRKEGADKESLGKIEERDRLAAAKVELTAIVRRLEESLAEKLPLFPDPLRNEPKVAQGIEDLKRDLALPEDQRDANVSKRLLNIINLLGEAEKFQQTVHIRQELKSDASGREFNMQVVYFGLGVAYAVNEDGQFALVGKPGPTGWTFTPRPELAPEISRLIAATTGDADATFVNLPVELP